MISHNSAVGLVVRGLGQPHDQVIAASEPTPQAWEGVQVLPAGMAQHAKMLPHSQRVSYLSPAGRPLDPPHLPQPFASPQPSALWPPSLSKEAACSQTQL